MKIKIKAKNEHAVGVLKSYGKMKHRGVSNVWDKEEESLLMGFPALSNVEKVKSAYVDFLEQTLKDNGLEPKEYEVTIE